MLNQSEVREALSYNPETGVMRWRITRCGRALAGSVAGSVGDNGYRVIYLNSRPYKAHRLAWLWATGDWPVQIDHKNHIRDDNRFNNLRPTDHRGNALNQSRRASNASGLMGVQLRRQRWRAYITVHGKQLTLGTFDTLLDAAAARKSAELHHGFHPNHGSNT